MISTEAPRHIGGRPRQSVRLNARSVQRRQRRGSICQRELLAKVNKAEDQPDDNDNADNPENVVHSRSPKVVAPQIVRISFLYFLNVEFAVQRGTLFEMQLGTLPSLIRCGDVMGG